MKIAVHQMTSGIDIQVNIDTMVAAIQEASENGAQIYFAPEMSLYLDKDRTRAQQNIMHEIDHPALSQIQNAAKHNGIIVHLGSLPICVVGSAPYANRSYIIGPDGEIVADYDKIHLFDVTLSSGETWRESKAYNPGDKAIVADVGMAKIGMSICYDIRFAALYNILSQAGAQIAVVPAAFTKPTGKAHWHILLRARAIENAMFIVAAAQCGQHADGRQTYGHSLVVDPWGEVLLDMGQDIGLGYADIDLERITEVRNQLPVLDHRRSIEPI